MQPDRPAPGIRRITTPLPWRPRTVHAYLVDLDDGALLVDGGADTDDAWSALESGVLGAARWDGVRVHVVTHMHLDHLGLARRVREAAGAPLAMGRLDAERAAHAAGSPDDEVRYRAELLRDCAADAELLDWAVRGARAGPAGFVPPDHLFDPPEAPVPGAAGWTAVWTPGHTAGHVSLFRAADRVLIGGDAVLPGITATIGVNRQRPDPVADFLEALDRLDALEPSVILPGHGDPIPDPRARLDQLRADTRAETGRVAELLSDTPATASEIARARYAGRDLPPAQRFQAVREVLAHLNHLVSRRLARAERVADRVRFSHL